MKWQQLNTEQLVDALIIGASRQVNAMAGKRKPNFPGNPFDLLRYHMSGAVAECFACIQMDVEWDRHIKSGIGRADIKVVCADGKEGWVEVRWSEGRKDIKVRPEDEDDIVVLGVRGPLTDLEIVGWVNAGTVKREVPLASPAPGNPAHFAPKRYHQDFQKLVDRIHGQRQPTREEPA